MEVALNAYMQEFFLVAELALSKIDLIEACKIF